MLYSLIKILDDVIGFHSVQAHPNDFHDNQPLTTSKNQPEAFAMNLFCSKAKQISAQKRSLLNANDDLSTDLTPHLGKRGLLQRSQPTN